MKVKGNEQGKVLTAPELKRLFSDGLVNERARCLFAICLFTGCRISSALPLQVTDIKNKTITFRKSTTKSKLKTRTIDIPAPLVRVGKIADQRIRVTDFDQNIIASL